MFAPDDNGSMIMSAMQILQRIRCTLDQGLYCWPVSDLF